MRIACIIMAHKEPLQVERLIRKFAPYPFDFFIHLDRKSNLQPFQYLEKMPNVRFIRQRIKVRWASYSFLQAVLGSLKEVLDYEVKYDFISVMSGQDYPIKPVQTIYESLEKNIGKNFICFEENDDWWSHAITRIRKYHFTNFGFRGRYRLQFFLNALLPKREFPLPYVLYGGPRAMCMTIDPDCARYVTSFIENDAKLRRFIRFTWGPDEFVIPTLIMNSDFRSTVVNNNFYYIDWSRGGANPKTLTVDDFDSLSRSEMMLARKFDMRFDAKILDMLDKIKPAG